MEEQKPLNPLISKSESNYAGGNLKWFIPYWKEPCVESEGDLLKDEFSPDDWRPKFCLF
jgi:hypothetical protein